MIIAGYIEWIWTSHHHLFIEMKYNIKVFYFNDLFMPKIG